MLAGAVGLDEFAVHVDGGGGEGVFTADEADEGEEVGGLDGGGGLEVEVAEGDDADVVFVPVDAVFSDADVLAFVAEGAELPDSAGAVDGEVVGDVDHAALEVGALDGLQMFGDVGDGGFEEGFAVAGVVKGDEFYAVHGAAAVVFHGDGGPCVAGHDGAVVGLEGLCRWGDDDGAVVGDWRFWAFAFELVVGSWRRGDVRGGGSDGRIGGAAGEGGGGRDGGGF